MHLSFCGCGFLGIYHIGVTRALLQHAPSFLSRVERVGGASAGALIGTILTCDPSKLEVCKEFNLNLAEEVRRKPLGALTPNFNLLDPVREFIETHMPEDGHQKADGVLYISLTNFRNGIPKNKIVSRYPSRKALIECLIATCYIPVYAGVKFPVIDGSIHTDGGLINNLIVFPEGRTLTVSPFCGGQDISPTDPMGLGWNFKIKNQNFQFNRTNGTRGLHAVFPPPRDVLLNYHDVGYNNALTFLKKEGFYEIP